MPACGKGLTIRTGKGGQYRCYGCSAKLNGGAKRCGCKSIRQEKLGQARAQRSQCQVAIGRLLEETMSPKTPSWPSAWPCNAPELLRSAQIDSLERQLVRGAARITPDVVDRFGETLK